MTFDIAWEAVHRERQWGIYYDPRLMTCVWREYGFRRDRETVRMVDLGCGVGAQATELARLGYSVAGIDGSPSAISRAKELTPPHLTNIAWFVQDIVELKPEPNVVDCVVEVACLECLSLEEAKIVLGKVAHMLKPDGTFFSIHKAHPWEQTVAKVGAGSRSLKRYDVDEFYGMAFESVHATYDIHHDAYDQRIPEWIVECRKPRKGTA